MTSRVSSENKEKKAKRKNSVEKETKQDRGKKKNGTKKQKQRHRESNPVYLQVQVLNSLTTTPH